MIMSNASTTSGSPQSKADTYWYENQTKNIRKFFDQIGFDSFDCNDDYKKTATFDTIGIAVAKRQIVIDGTQYTVLGLVPRSGGYFSEWGNNVWIGDGSSSDYMHEGWYNAAKKGINFLNDYIKKNNISGDLKLWVTGYSRGAAVQNVMSGLIDNAIDSNLNVLSRTVNLEHNNLYAYTFEAPQGANVNSKAVKTPRDNIYNNIWNIINPNDIVPKLAPSEWGFTRFGTDLFITTKFYDPVNFDGNRAVAKSFVDQNQINRSDSLTMYGISLANGASTIINLIKNGIDISCFEKDQRKVNYDANIVSTILLETVVEKVGTRQNYCDNYQSYAKEVLLIYNDDTSARGNAVSEDVKQAGLGKIIFGAAIYKIVGESIGEKIVSSWNLLNNSQDLNTLVKAVNKLLPVLSSAFADIPNEMITVALEIGDIFKNHDIDMNIGHLKAQDSFYIDAWNKTHSANKLHVVPLMKNADFARASFSGFNDVELNVNGTKVVDVNGSLWGYSNVQRCDAGYAVGYYSYQTIEEMELFFPIDEKYEIAMKSYSKKIQHKVTYDLYYQHISLDSHGVVKEKLSSISKTVMFNSSVFKDTYSSVFDLWKLKY